MKKFLGIMLVVVCILFIVVPPQVVAAHGGDHGGGHDGGHGGAPEIDPGVASGAIGLLAGGVLKLTGKRKGRQRKDK